jgi:methionyl-tRNA synthetase
VIELKEKFYITTTIPYANAPPHIGFALEIVQADVLARWNKLKGRQVFFLTGTDEHGTKNYQTAKSLNLTPQAFVDKNAAHFKELTKVLNISNDYFIRTTDKKVHWPGVIHLWKILAKKGDIYKKKYTGYYCSGCERFITEKDLKDGKCPNHPNIEVEKVSETNYFFKLSKYSDKITKLVETGKLRIRPVRWKNNFLSLIKDGLYDVSFSRDKEHLPWGIGVPGDKEQVMYVWCDALTNYLTGIGFPNKKYKKFWPADVHAVGKDMLRFHAGIWPGMLLSAGIPLPKEIIVHGFLTVNGHKMSKSLGNVISPIKLVEKYPADAIRYLLIREIPFGEDGDFSEKTLIARINGELLSDIGNLVSRVLTLAERAKKSGIKPKGKSVLDKKLKLNKIEKYMDDLELHHALDEIMNFVRATNKYINENEPWKQEGKALANTIYNLLESLRIIAILIQPFMPATAEKINKQIGIKTKPLLKDCKFKPWKGKPKKGEHLFEKVKDVDDKESKQTKARAINVRVDRGCQDLGIKAVAAVVSGITVKKKKGQLEKLKKETVNSYKFKQDDIANAYKEIYKKVGVKGIDHPIQTLRGIVKKSGKLPTINTVVDSYNMVALEKGLSIGAHDLDKIKGNVAFKITNGSEDYKPLGTDKAQKVNKGEYACTDEARVICRMDIKQCDGTKIDERTGNVFIYVQGNKATSHEYIRDALKQACENIIKFCGGKYRILE